MSDTFIPEPERYELFEEPRYQFEPDRRDFLAVAGGLVVYLLLADDEAAAQRPGGGRPQELGAWLHIDDKGQVTGYTGKAEVGQNIRTSLSQVIAEELRLPVSSVRLVMADTDAVPYDAGTFGSRTTPDMAAQLRKAAAAAREALIELAAETAKVARGELTVADGKVAHAASKRSFPFGELTQGKKLTKAVKDDAPVTPAEKWQVLGKPAAKADGRDIVTGKHKYASDVKRPGMLFGKVLRPETLGATLTAADTKAAEAMPGVKVVRDGNFLGLVAPTDYAAQVALDAIKAEWKPGADISDKTLFDDLKKNRGGGGGFGRGDFTKGSVEKGLDGADHKVKATYTIAYIAHVPLEPRAAVAEWDDGKLTVWAGTQRPFGVRDDLARAFSLKTDRVRVIVPDTGSGYGGKHTLEAATEAARLAKAAGKPVKLVWTRQEEMTWAYFRPAGVIEVNAGVKNDGTLTAWDFENINSGGAALRTPYDAPNQRCAARVSSAPLRQGSYRALASTANTFAREVHMDELAAAAGMDPLEFRLKNLTDRRLRAVLEAAAKAFDWGKAKPEAGRGFGIACGTEKGGYVATCAEVEADKKSGKVQVLRAVTAFECGAVLNPEHLKNQVEGAVVMGLGGALFEAIRFDGSKIVSDRLSRYRVPRFGDAPVQEVVLLDRKDLASAGAGECPIIAIAPAVGGAIFQASGVRLRSLPMVPDGLKG